MAKERLPMRMTRELLRLRWEQSRSVRENGRKCGREPGRGRQGGEPRASGTGLHPGMRAERRGVRARRTPRAWTVPALRVRGPTLCTCTWSCSGRA